MVTGDFAGTASAIAKTVGIFSSDKIDTVLDLSKEGSGITTYVRPTEDDNRPLRSLVLSGSDL